ncbi:MAG: hypothetical protein U1D30_17075 [Planctomycetota bacterium]
MANRFRFAFHWSDTQIAATMFAIVATVYFGTGTSYPLPDNLLHLRTAERLLTKGVFTLSMEDVASSLEWRLQTRDGSKTKVSIGASDESIRSLVATGELQPQAEPLSMTALARGPNPGTYVSVFMPGTSLSALPAVAICLMFSKDRPLRDSTLYVAGKFTATICTAATVALLYLMARQRQLNRAWSLLLALAYAFATCIWTINSQSLWQHGPNGLFLAAGMYFLLKNQRTTRDIALAAIAMSAATWIRPTSAIFALAGCFNLRHAGLLLYVALGTFAGLLMAVYNTTFFGAPWTLGESLVTRDALVTTNAGSIWGTPFFEGAAGLLFSPSRGLFVFSPFFVISIVGMIKIWRDSRFGSLRPWSIAVLVIWCIHFKYYDWWGGGSFGYRPLVDTVFILMLFMIPVLQSPWSERYTFRLFLAVSVAWSFAIQLGAVLTFDPYSWNSRTLYAIHSPQGDVRLVNSEIHADAIAQVIHGTVKPVIANIDLPAYRYRLWSVTDSQIGFMLTHAGELFHFRPRVGWRITDGRELDLALSHASLAEAFLNANEVENARREISLARRYHSTHPVVQRISERVANTEANSNRRTTPPVAPQISEPKP